MVLRCNLGCFGTKCFATRSQDTLTRRATTTHQRPAVVEVFPTLIVRVVGRCGGRPGGVVVAVDARSGGGGVSPSAAQRPPYRFVLV